VATWVTDQAQKVIPIGAYDRNEFCGDPSQALKGDLNLDCYIDLFDFIIMPSILSWIYFGNQSKECCVLFW
jgi:hypothetical protein